MYNFSIEDYDQVVDDEKEFISFEFNDFDNFDYIISKLSETKKINMQIIINFLALENIPESIFNLKNIFELDLYDNNLKNIHPDIVKITNLNFLNISHNKLEDFPINICECKNLKFLDLSNCNLTTIPPSISKLDKLQVLWINDNNFKDFPINICECKNLKYLNISNCNLTTIPDCISKLKKLKVLYLNDNKIDNLNDLKNIKTIIYNYQKI